MYNNISSPINYIIKPENECTKNLKYDKKKYVLYQDYV